MVGMAPAIAPNVSKIHKVFVFCGANNIDKALFVPRTSQSNFIDTNSHSATDHTINSAKVEFTKLFDFISSWAGSASINVLNILPRESFLRNYIINILNEHIHMLCNQKESFKMICTEEDRRLFSFRNGYRKTYFFSNLGSDNVHLNNSGLVRLAKHLKYSAHT